MTNVQVLVTAGAETYCLISSICEHKPTNSVQKMKLFLKMLDCFLVVNNAS